MKAVLSALAVCAALTGYLVWRIYGLLAMPTGARGLLYSLPLMAVTSGWLAGIAWRSSRGETIGPWKLIIAEVMFLCTVLVIVCFR